MFGHWCVSPGNDPSLNTHTSTDTDLYVYCIYSNTHTRKYTVRQTDSHKHIQTNTQSYTHP